MKRLITLGILGLFLAGTAKAQTNTGNSSRTTGAVSSTGHTKSIKSKTKKGTAKTAQPANQRKEYKGGDGQTATPTGHEATGTNSTQAATRKDSTKQK